MSIGATLEGPFVQVVRFPAAGRILELASSVEAWNGDGRGAGVSLTTGGRTTGATTSALSDRPISDFLNHDGLDDVGVEVAESLELRPISGLFPAEDPGMQTTWAAAGRQHRRNTRERGPGSK